MLTLVEYLLLLYRGLLPAPVWYRFFLNKEYGSIFSSLITGLYLTFKLTSIVEKVFSTLLRCPVYGFLSLFYLCYFILNSQLINCAFLDDISYLVSGSIFCHCSKGTVTQRSTLWLLCNNGTGSSLFFSLMILCQIAFFGFLHVGLFCHFFLK